MRAAQLRERIGGAWAERSGGWWLVATPADVRGAARAMLGAGARLSAVVATPGERGTLRLWWSWDLGGALLSVEVALAAGEAAPSVADIYPGADWAEREAREYYALSFAGREDTAPLMLRDGQPQGVMLRPPGSRP